MDGAPDTVRHGASDWESRVWPPSFKLAYQIPWQVAKKMPKFCGAILILPRID